MTDEIDDSELYETWFSEVCCRCQHFAGDSLQHTCDAFPDGIPREIWEGRHLHNRPYPGDTGIGFEQAGD